MEENKENMQLWEQVHTDCEGGWIVKVKCKDGKIGDRKILTLTAVDQGTGFPEIWPIETASSYVCATVFDKNWLCRYPRPKRVVYDNGSEFTGQEFQELLASYGVEAKPTTVKNPEANGTVERLNLIMRDILRIKTFKGDNFD